MSTPKEIISDFQTIYDQLDALESITPSTILTPRGSEERYDEILEELYVALGRVETEVDVLQERLEYQHQRLDGLRDAVYVPEEQGRTQKIDPS